MVRFRASDFGSGSAFERVLRFCWLTLQDRCHLPNSLISGVAPIRKTETLKSNKESASEHASRSGDLGCAAGRHKPLHFVDVTAEAGLC